MLQRGHPIRDLLDQAALGSQPTKRQLDALADYEDLPDGQSLARFRNRLARAAAEVAELYRADGGIRRSQARSWELADEIAAAMTDEQRAVSGEARPEPLGDIAKRIFSH